MEGSYSSKEWKLPPLLLLALMLRLSPRGLSRPHQSYLSRFWSHAGRLRRYDNGRVGVCSSPPLRSFREPAGTVRRRFFLLLPPLSRWSSLLFFAAENASKSKLTRLFSPYTFLCPAPLFILAAFFCPLVFADRVCVAAAGRREGAKCRQSG